MWLFYFRCWGAKIKTNLLTHFQIEMIIAPYSSFELLKFEQQIVSS